MNRSQHETVSLRTQALSRLGVFYKNLRTGEGFANLHWQRLGHSRADMHGDRWLEHVHPDDRARVREAVNQHLAGHTPEFQAEYRVRDREGRYRWFISSGMVERYDAAGTPLTYVGHDEDVTDLHTLREALQDARHEAEARASEAEALRSAGAVVVASLNPPTAVRAVVEQLHTLVPLDSALVLELENRKLRFVGGSSDVHKANWQAFARPRRHVLLKVIQSRTPELARESDDAQSHELYVPLVVRGVTDGVLVLSRARYAFAAEEVRIPMSMGD